MILLAMHQPSHADEPSLVLNKEHASAFARLALKGLSKEYPNKPEHVSAGRSMRKTPKALHPAFYGSYDWHSSVHGHWMLVRLLRLFPDLKEAPEIRAVLSAHLTAENLKAEADYFARKESKSFERPYGWAWLLKLAQELHGWDDPDGKIVGEKPPAARGTDRRSLSRILSRSRPTRSGPACTRTRRSGWRSPTIMPRSMGDTRLTGLVEERARAYFGADADVPAGWEPGGADFFSPSLIEADLMRRVLPPASFGAWFERFLPGASKVSRRRFSSRRR